MATSNTTNMLPTPIQPPPSKPYRPPHLRLTPDTQHNKHQQQQPPPPPVVDDGPPTLAALVALSEPDQPIPPRPIPQTTRELRDILHNTLLQLVLYETGDPNPESHPDLRPLPSPRKPVQYYRAFASGEEARILQRLEVLERELHAWKMWVQEEEIKWMRGEVVRGLDDDDAAEMSEVEEGKVVVDNGGRTGDVDECFSPREVGAATPTAFRSGASDLEVVIKSEAEPEAEPATEQEKEATSTFFELYARSVLPVADATTTESNATTDRSQRSITRRRRPQPLILTNEAPGLTDYLHIVGRNGSLDFKPVSGCNFEGLRSDDGATSYDLEQSALESGPEKDAGSQSLTHHSEPETKSIRQDPCLAAGIAVHPQQHHPSLENEETLARRGIQQWEAAQAALQQRHALLVADPSAPLQQARGYDEELARQGIQRWNEAQAAFQQSHHLEPSGDSTIAANSVQQQQLSPKSEVLLAQRGLRQWWVAQTAHQCRLRAERYRLVDAARTSTRMAGGALPSYGRIP